MTTVIADPATLITLYTQPSCGPCVAAKRALESAGIPFTVRDIRTDAEAAARVEELGYRGTPVIEAGLDHWQGVRPDKIDELVERLENGQLF